MLRLILVLFENMQLPHSFHQGHYVDSTGANPEDLDEKYGIIDKKVHLDFALTLMCCNVTAMSNLMKCSGYEKIYTLTLTKFLLDFFKQINRTNDSFKPSQQSI